MTSVTGNGELFKGIHPADQLSSSLQTLDLYLNAPEDVIKPKFSSESNLVYAVDRIGQELIGLSTTHTYDDLPNFPGIKASAVTYSVIGGEQEGDDTTRTNKEKFDMFGLNVREEVQQSYKEFPRNTVEYASQLTELALSFMEFNNLKNSWELDKAGNNKGGYSQEDSRNVVTKYANQIKDFTRHCGIDSNDGFTGMGIINFLRNINLGGLSDRLIAIRFGLSVDAVKEVNNKVGRVLTSERHAASGSHISEITNDEVIEQLRTKH